MSAVERLLATAQAEEGYLEKASNAQLDSKTGNAGRGNWTKYAADLDALGVVYNGKKNGFDWCDIFVDWCFIKAFGLETAIKLLCQEKRGAGAGCTYSARYYKNKGRFYTSGPKPGDQIFFTKDAGKTFYHTGIVERVSGGRVYTIEGNTSSASGVVENGGCVARKSYALNYSRIGGYGRPDWSIVEKEDEDMDQATFDKMMENYLARKAKEGVSPWAANGVKQAKAEGIMDGTRPRAFATREECAQMILNAKK